MWQIAVTSAAGEVPPALATVLAAAAIEEVWTTPKRSSPRLAKQRYRFHAENEKRLTWKDLDFGGNFTDFSFIPYSDAAISSSISHLGVSLGSNPSLVSSSINILKEVEMARITTEPSSMEDFSKSVLSNDEDEEAENVTFGHLYGDLMEEIMDDEYDHLSCDFKTIFKKNKSLSLTRAKRMPKVRVIKKT